MPPPEIILASQSIARRKMLKNAGVKFSVVPANIDEETIIKDMRKQNLSAAEIARKLAETKALSIANNHKNTLVIGCDQVLEFEGNILSKSTNTEEAQAKLKLLRGKTHKLISALSVVKGDMVLWNYTGEAALDMHDFDDHFLDNYCKNAGQALTSSVGGYEIEALGSWLFFSIKGDYFTVLGMPLLPLLAYLHEHHGGRP